MRITDPGFGTEVHYTGDVEIVGAAYWPGYIKYEVQYAPVDESGNLTGNWSVIGYREDAPVGGSEHNVWLATWTARQRRGEDRGEYAFAIKMLDEQGQHRWMDERCWVIITLR